MKPLLFFFLLISFSVFAQDFSKVDATVKTYPKFISAEKLASKISTDFSSDSEKVRAIYTWLTLNIRYDLNELYNPTQPQTISFSYSTEEERQQKLKAIKAKIVTETLIQRKAVCEGYAQTFSKVCNILKIENEIISGYVRNTSQEIGRIANRTNHAWNAVKLNGKWKYFDATWGAGYEMNGRWQRAFNDYYFDIPKEKLFLSHYPDETLWQLRVKRMTKKDFYNQPIYGHTFLKSNIELVSPTSGFVKKDKNGLVEIQLKNLAKNQRVYVGFDTSNYAKRPITSLKEKVTSIKINPPKGAKQLFVTLNNDVVLEFLIQ